LLVGLVQAGVVGRETPNVPRPAGGALPAAAVQASSSSHVRWRHDVKHDTSAPLCGMRPVRIAPVPKHEANPHPVVPGDIDGSILPPAGAPDPWLASGGASSWPFYRFHVDFANPGNASATAGFSGSRTGGSRTGTRGARGGNRSVSSDGVPAIRWFEV